MGPLQVVLDALLSDAAVRAQFGLAHVRADHALARLPGDLTGPSATYALVARHPRFRAHSQGDWQDGGLQHHGRQTVDELNYIMESRPERGLYIFMHHQPPLAASRSRGARDILGKQSLEANPAVQVARHEVDCDNANVFAGPALFRDDAGAWKATLELVFKAVRDHRCKSRDAVVNATGLMADGDEEGHAPTLLDSLRDLASQDFVEESSRAAKRRGEARNECPTPPADLSPSLVP